MLKKSLERKIWIDFRLIFLMERKVKKNIIICLVLKESLRLNTSVTLNYSAYLSYKLFENQKPFLI